jgi:hypothetical protein
MLIVLNAFNQGATAAILMVLVNEYQGIYEISAYKS